jgi:tetratricopeptide (TPR) repeat protein
MLPEFAECLHIMGRVHATLGNLEKAGEFLSAAAGAAIQSGRRQEAAEVLLSLAHLAMEQRDVDAARELFENARAASDDGEFQAKCLMELSRVAAKQGHEDQQRDLVKQAVETLKADLAGTKPEMERAKRYFTLGWYLREAGQLEEALSCVRKARERFDAAGDAYGAAKASFEAAGLLDNMGRKSEAREMCHVVLNMIEGKPFFEIAAAVDIALSKFALYDDRDLGEAGRLLQHGLGLCKEHDLPLLAEALLLNDELEHAKLAGTEASASIPDLLDFLHQQIAVCPANKEGYLRFWAFSEARKLGSALHGTLGPNVAIVTDDMAEFLHLSAVLKPFRDWSLIVPPSSYPENILDIIPISGEMLVPAGVPFLVRRSAGAGGDSSDSSDPQGLRPTVRRGPEVRAELAVSHLSKGGAIARYYAVLLEGQQVEQFGGAKLGVQGESLALPPVVHDLLQGRDVEELKANRLFFIYYNRGHLDEAKRLWYDLAIMHPFRCLPIYRAALPRSRDVRVVASCPIVLPIIEEQSAEEHKSVLRKVRKTLLQVLASDENTAAGKLSDFEAVTEELAEKVGEAPSIRLKLYMLGFEYEGTARTHPAIVINR